MREKANGCDRQEKEGSQVESVWRAKFRVARGLSYMIVEYLFVISGIAQPYDIHIDKFVRVSSEIIMTRNNVTRNKILIFKIDIL